MQTNIAIARPANWSARIIFALSSTISSVRAFLNRQAIVPVIILALVSFFSFALGALRFGAASGIAFMIAIRPFVNRPAVSESTNHYNH